MTPDVRVVRGEPDEVELAALVAGLAARGSHPPGADRSDEPGPRAGRRWRGALHPAARVPAPGPDAWRWSLHPRG
ncbi:acyl-CoA carboxylase subunit epsilon [Cellulomonas sp. APG4]|uniref:acyl-CoA carboxylase epsilon subunit n=1 Tax=Cellulomonas sp. APG4 TaxID=1538656 RepID=UPI00137B75F8|nr:acyl-CoA carboxylase subunit epsilon [Cellulomonas sp. APG4]